MTRINIYCDQGHSRWHIATMRKGGADGHPKIWMQDTKSSHRRRLERFRTGDTSLPDDQPVNYKRIRDGKEVAPAAPSESPAVYEHVTYTFKCEHCVNLRRHSTVTRRAERLAPILDLLLQAGLREVSLDQLARGIGEYDRERRS
ncbi:hypothetical protein A6F49_17095 [Enteractinococcus helveticum]|uniref:Uncharacterized protein n=2 Tax=Enteractinococcus helveticum TaxID=1837282 RepID=A0A1B7LWW6_9MICC|nr:hypothetical protein A6F49_17095 [Enteractinococcus helveticum]